VNTHDFTPHVWRRWLGRALREPLAHFLVLGGLIFSAHRLATGDPRSIVISPELKAELARRFQDSHGQEPSAQQLERAVEEWKQDEVLYREALRAGLDRDDATIRQVLADRLRARLAFESEEREPTDGELARWLAEHRESYETPLVYDFELIQLPKSDPNALDRIESVERALAAGTEPRALPVSVVGAALPAAALDAQFGAALGSRIRALPNAGWQRLDDERSVALGRLKRVTGGVPSFEELEPRLLADWKLERQHAALARRLRELVARYRFEEP
jgi:hypothetical protein